MLFLKQRRIKRSHIHFPPWNSQSYSQAHLLYNSDSSFTWHYFSQASHLISVTEISHLKTSAITSHVQGCCQIKGENIREEHNVVPCISKYLWFVSVADVSFKSPFASLCMLILWISSTPARPHSSLTVCSEKSCSQSIIMTRKAKRYCDNCFKWWFYILKAP